MQYGKEATITTETAGLDTDYKSVDPGGPELTLPVSRNRRRRAGRIPTVAIRYPRAGRKVLVPGKRKARQHPWAMRLLAARTGGVSVDETHPGNGIITMSCFRPGCGDRVDQKVGDGKSRAEQKAEDKFREIVRHHSAGECVAVTA